MPMIVYEDYHENSNIPDLSYDLIVKNLETSLEFLREYYYLFYEFSPENIDIPLNLISQWINNDLISAKLKQDEFEEVITNVSFLVDEILKNKTTIKPKNYLYEYLYKYIAENDFSRAYEVYEVLC